MSDTNPKLLKHFQNPKNVGIIENADGYARVENPINGYMTDIYIRVENGRIEDVKFKTFGCVVTIASASALTEIVKGKTLDEIVDNENPVETLIQLIEGELGEIPEKNWHCPPTAIRVLLSAISDYYRKNKNEIKVNEIEKILIALKCYFDNKMSQLGDE